MGLYLFGYGSLVWKADFPYKRKLHGCIKGFSRRFWLWDPVHRGTEDSPGLVVTVLKQEDEKEPRTCVWGTIYEFPESNEEEIMKHLRHRERAGYSENRVEVYSAPDEQDPMLTDVLLFSAGRDSDLYTGPLDLEFTAQKITESKGPSGSNLEYLHNLCQALREIHDAALDDYLSSLEEHVKLRTSTLLAETTK